MPAAVAGHFGWHAAMIGRAGVEVRALEIDAGQARMQVFPLFQPRQDLPDVFHGNGEADSRVVPFHAGDSAGGVGRKRDENAHHAAADIDQRPAVVVRRNGGVGLNGLAPDSIDRAENSHRHVGPVALEGSADGDGPLADAHLAPAGDLAYRQRLVRVDFQQHEHPRVIGGHQFGRLALAVGQPHEDRSGFVDEVERAGDDVAAGIDRQPRRRAGAKQHSLDFFQAADGLDLHDRRRHAIDGGLQTRPAPERRRRPRPTAPPVGKTIAASSAAATASSFPRSAWERPFGRSASIRRSDAERRDVRSHAERGNEETDRHCLPIMVVPSSADSRRGPDAA